MVHKINLWLSRIGISSTKSRVMELLNFVECSYKESFQWILEISLSLQFGHAVDCAREVVLFFVAYIEYNVSIIRISFLLGSDFNGQD